MARTRSEYRWEAAPVRPDAALPRRRPVTSDRDELAALVLDAYRGTVDDEGETLDDALVAVDDWLDRLAPEHSFVVVDDDAIIAVCFVVDVDARSYVDPIVVSPALQRRGLAQRAVACALASLVESGVVTVGATITDGNVASERLFASLGFRRVGPWPAEGRTISRP